LGTWTTGRLPQDFVHVISQSQSGAFGTQPDELRWNDWPNSGVPAKGYVLETGNRVITDGDGTGFNLPTWGLAYVSGDLSTMTAAATALSDVKEAINDLSRLRAEVGSALRRIEFHVDELQTLSENLDTTVSRITDVDVAVETAEFSRAQILTQSGTAMLTQANTLPQSVLKLLS
jgi:flagellin-like hook-associated protein FlgL